LEDVQKIAIVEDHHFYRHGLCLALKRIRSVELVFDAVNGKDFLDKLKNQPVDIVLMDILMPVMDGYETVMELQKYHPGIKVIILTMRNDEENIRRFIDAGVDGYLLKNIDNADLENALNAVIKGQNYYSTEIMSFLTMELRRSKTHHIKNSPLSQRELEILQLMYEGYSNQEIADRLYISVRTVTNHRYHIMQKTGAKNAAGLIGYGIKHRLLRT
jgi:DNA-binding NarL/FixJ family response regulator